MVINTEAFMPPETTRDSQDTETIRFLRNKCYDGEDYGPGYDQQVAEVRQDWARFFVKRGDAEYVERDEDDQVDEPEADDSEAEEDAEEEAAEDAAPTFDTVADLEDAIAETDDPDQVRAIRDAEADGQDRVTAIEACEERLEELEGES